MRSRLFFLFANLTRDVTGLALILLTIDRVVSILKDKRTRWLVDVVLLCKPVARYPYPQKMKRITRYRENSGKFVDISASMDTLSFRPKSASPRSG